MAIGVQIPNKGNASSNSTASDSPRGPWVRQEEIVSAEAPVAVQVPYRNHYDGTKYDWMRSAEIRESDFGYVDFIIQMESGWNPNATNASSGAHGLPQALPYAKTGCGWSDPICQLRWANGYALDRYGSWYAAYVFWSRVHWW